MCPAPTAGLAPPPPSLPGTEWRPRLPGVAEAKVRGAATTLGGQLRESQHGHLLPPPLKAS